MASFEVENKQISGLKELAGFLDISAAVTFRNGTVFMQLDQHATNVISLTLDT
jgi:hypothetical protein